MNRKVVREYYVLSIIACFGQSIITAMYVSFLMSHGLDLFQVNVVNFIYFSTLFLTEIPTGAFADVFGRKASYITSCVLNAMGMFIYAASTSFWGFALAESVAALGATFASGAFRAWFVDRIRHHGYEGTLNPLFVNVSQVRRITTILAAIMGAYIADISMIAPWIIGGITMLVGAVVALPIKEEYFIKKSFSFMGGLTMMKQTVRDSITYAVNSKNVRFVLVLVVAQIFAVQAPNMQWQPFFKQWLPDQGSLGLVYGGISIALLVGSSIAPYILRRMRSERRALMGFQIVIGLCLAASAVTGVYGLTIVMFLLHECARGGFEPIKDAYLHDNIPSKTRATIESFESLAHHAGGAVGLVVTGFLANTYGISATWIVCGVLLIVATMVVAKNGKSHF